MRLTLALLLLVVAQPVRAQEALEALRPEFPFYPGAESWMPVGDELFYGRYGMQAVSFRTQDPPGTVIPFYVKAFKAQNLVPGKLPIADSEPEWVIVGIDPDRMIQKLVWAQPDGKGSFVMLALAPMGQSPDRVADPAPPLVPSGCKQSSSTGSRDGQIVTRVITLLCDGPRAQVVKLYGEGMRQAGFQQDDPLPGSEEATWKRDAQAWSVRVVEAKGHTSVIMVQQTKGASPAQARGQGSALSQPPGNAAPP
ncbi:hypothetical protein [Hyalangium versicolor]|uniref:hypothetical protein n=1 Tax=Hyalangium versicolor TaxID=2861190 RepID=UPI001CCD9910|nr:hypothetical protein [Hyalangium versicolor]